MTEPVIARIDRGMAFTVEHRLADVLLMESSATSADFAELFASLPGLAMVVAVSSTEEIVIGIREGTMLTLSPLHGVGNRGVLRSDLYGVARPLYLQWARCRWTFGIAGGRIEWDPELGSKYVVTVGTWCSSGASRNGERANFLHPFPQPGGMR